MCRVSKAGLDDGQHGTDLREWTRSQFTARLRKANLPLSAGLAVAGPLVYWWWEAIHDMDVDDVGLILAAVIPVLLYMFGTWLSYWVRAPFHVFWRYKEYFEERNPRSPWRSSD
jgi:hypothetical protein